MFPPRAPFLEPGVGEPPGWSTGEPLVPPWTPSSEADVERENAEGSPTPPPPLIGQGLTDELLLVSHRRRAMKAAARHRVLVAGRLVAVHPHPRGCLHRSARVLGDDALTAPPCARGLCRGVPGADRRAAGRPALGARRLHGDPRTGLRPQRAGRHETADDRFCSGDGARRGLDRKSTRLNSSHGSISYAVFCLKNKKRQIVSRLLLATSVCKLRILAGRITI